MTAVTAMPTTAASSDRHPQSDGDHDERAPRAGGHSVERADVHDRGRQAHQHVAEHAAADGGADAYEDGRHLGDAECEGLARPESAEHADHHGIEHDDRRVQAG